MADFEEASQRFQGWLSRSGADISNKIELRDLRAVNAGRGVVAAQDVDEDEILFRIPRSSVLCVENSILSKEIPKATFDTLGPWLSLILVMLYEYENKSASNWAPYFNVLPMEFNTLMFWDANELEELQASAVRTKIGKESADENFKKELVPVIKEFAEVFFSGDGHARARAEEMSSPENLLLMHKMGSLIMAYAFDVEPGNVHKDVDEDGYASEDEDDALPKGMVPMADMLNADADRNNARLFYEEDSLTMKALKPIKAGEEIFNDYGPLPRSDLLRRYGYITDNYAQYDVAEIPTEEIVAHVSSLSHSSTLAERMDYLDEHDVVDTGYDITNSDPFNIQESIPPELIVLVQFLLLPDDGAKRLMGKGKLPKPGNIAREVVDCLLKIVKARLEQYKTFLEDDIAATDDFPTTQKELRYAMAKHVRIGEKRILTSAGAALARMAQELGGTNSIEKRLNGDAGGPSRKKQKTR
ncbi:SET domain-containing protein [Lophiostoma macrostomum CBS 122681]|uniref:Ribosomal lysine N-methyltransferase 4 n=1 Tax=Lophiostoma macrostomum CBS 122681 TaxID=1314788 RepID=A0A6A6TH66_9PLEO|nr:SET domain-containing protein [Lophiostoma macrostomum CBS 122681]